ncbi:hypothetical protein [Modestobacter excelsi]|uniref:hypothetical protein n=1 Tax=Modestobacter excelsi TaxID=2213161 RepID=UPI00110CCCFB|nr:hypothetical protein [Modestobacter excelsi]
MFENQMVELLPARTTMTKKGNGGGKKSGNGGNKLTITQVAVAVVAGNTNTASGAGSEANQLNVAAASNSIG